MIRLLKAASPYPAYLDAFYHLHPDLTDLSYTDQMRTYQSDSFAGTGVWKRGLEALGDFEVWEVAINAETMQKTWAREHGVAFDADTWMYDIFLAQCRLYRPQLLYALAFDVLTPDYVRRIKQVVPNLRVINYEGIALMDPERFADSDLVLSCAEFILEPYRMAGLNTTLLPHGFDPAVLDRIERGRNLFAASFVGSLALRERGHTTRLGWLDTVSRRIPVTPFLLMPDPVRFCVGSVKSAVIEWKATPLHALHSQLLPLFRLHKRCKEPVFGVRMFQVLADSQVTLNCHIDAAGEHAANMRLFEATGVGTCLVTDWKSDLGNYFELDTEVVAYKTSDECVEKVKYLLDHPRERQAIAERGQRRTLRDYDATRQVQALGTALRDLVA